MLGFLPSSFAAPSSFHITPITNSWHMRTNSAKNHKTRTVKSVKETEKNLVSRGWCAKHEVRRELVSAQGMSTRVDYQKHQPYNCKNLHHQPHSLYAFLLSAVFCFNVFTMKHKWQGYRFDSASISCLFFSLFIYSDSYEFFRSSYVPTPI